MLVAATMLTVPTFAAKTPERDVNITVGTAPPNGVIQVVVTKEVVLKASIFVKEIFTTGTARRQPKQKPSVVRGLTVKVKTKDVAIPQNVVVV